MTYETHAEFADLVGVTISGVTRVKDDEELIFEVDGKPAFRMYHAQDCCESVSIESIVGDLADVIGSPILKAEEATSDKHPEGHATEPSPYAWGEDSFTWTFYKLATIKGYVDIRWYGSSNGYYSESVDFDRIAS